MNSYIITSDYEDDEDGVLFWSNEDGWVDRASATVFTEAVRDDALLPDGAAGWVRASSSYEVRLREASGGVPAP